MAITVRPMHARATAHEAARPADAADIPALHLASPARARLADAAPLVASLFIVTSLFWAPFNVVTATILGASLTFFFVYWTIRSYAVAVACAIGLRRITAWKRTDWPARYAAWTAARGTAAEAPDAWDWPRHMVIIPNYKESETGLARTIDSLAAQPNAQQLVVVLAMEQREPASPAKAAHLIERYTGRFAQMVATFHPGDIPGEAAGKGSNEAWAAREAYTRLIIADGEEITRYTVTSCDADAVFHERHFEALNYLFLTAEDRYRTFWQPTIFNSNNIWDVPAPLRLPDGLSGINRLANLVLPFSVKFPTSCYSLSWAMLAAVDYWDEEVIPEDWHLYLKACFTLGDRVHVEPLYLPLGNDGVLADGYGKTLRAHYTQAVRHAWGASDIPYAWLAWRRTRQLSRGRGLLLASALTKVHVMWAAQWSLVTLGILVPSKLAGTFGARMPYWWTHKGFHIPGPGWHPEHAMEPSRWFAFDHTGLVEPSMWLNFSGLMIALCILPLFALIVIELRTRGPRPADFGFGRFVLQFAMWPLMAVVTLIWACLPAFHAQWRLATGRGLIYRVAEKGTRAERTHLAAPADTEATALPLPALSIVPATSNEERSL